jgi:tetratricopeptide (TPR) repeat protein/predicted Ser/Thr protein kinase
MERSAWLPEERIGRFPIIRILGEGGMGVVLLAHDPELDRPIALKLLLSDEDERTRLLHEARAMARVSHPNVVTVHDVGVHAGRVFIAMEFVEGATLHEWLQTPRSAGDILAVMAAAGRGLLAAHQAGVVHGDFKPENVLVGSDGRVRVSDFGLAVRAEACSSPFGRGGTPLYMAPEQHRGERASVRSDQYAFATTLFVALTGRKPFAAASRRALQLEKEGGPSDDTILRLASSLGPVVRRALSPHAEDRYATMSDLLAAMDPLDAPSPVAGSPHAIAPVSQATSWTTELSVSGSIDFNAWLAWFRESAGAAGHVESSRFEHGVVARWTPAAETMASDRARHAARIALGSRAAWPTSNAAIVTFDANADQTVRAAAKAGPGAIVVDAPTTALLGGAFLLAPIGAGFFSLLEHGSEETPFQGRTSEMRTLVDAFDSVARGSALAILVVGVAGIGKSRLVKEFLRHVHANVWWGRADVFKGGAALGLVRSLAASAAGGEEPADLPLEARAAFKEIAGADLESIAEARDRAHAHELSFGDHVNMALSARVRSACSHGPLIIVLEDLHWADHASVLAIDRLLSACADLPLLLVATSRLEVDDKFPTLWANQPLRRLELDEVSPSIAQAIARSVPGSACDDDEAARITRQAGGNPFLLEQTVRFVRELGLEATRAAGPLAEAYMARLAPKARAVLRTASVLGESFTAEAVAALMGAPTDEVIEELRALSAKQLLKPAHPVRPSYAFSHALLRDGAYAALSSTERSKAHRLAGDWLERKGESLGFVLAEHFALGDDERAPLHFERAARQALEAHDYQAAVDLVHRGLAHRHAPALGARLWMVAALAQHWAASYPAAVSAASRALEIAERCSPTWWEAIGLLSASSTRVRGAVSAVELARILPDPIPADDVAVGAAARIANTMLREASSDPIAMRIVEQVRALAPQVQDSWARARCSEIETTLADASGDLAIARAECVRTVAEFTRACAWREAAIYRANLGFRRAVLGEFETAADDLREAMREGRRLGLRPAESLGRLNLVEVLLALGRAEEALPLAIRSVAEFAGDAQLEAHAQSSYAQALFALGRLDEASQAAEAAVRASAEGDGVQIEALTRASACHLAKGELEAAYELSQRALRSLALSPARPALAFGAPVAFARACVALNRHDEAREAIEESRAELRERASRISDPAARETYLAIREHAEILAFPIA